VTHASSSDDLVAVGRDIESRVLARAVRLHLERRAFRMDARRWCSSARNATTNDAANARLKSIDRPRFDLRDEFCSAAEIIVFATQNSPTSSRRANQEQAVDIR
jgi:hypothetical protein